MWLRVLEVWLTARLLASPTFHNVVRRVHKQVHEVRHGKDPSEMGGTNMDHPGGSGSNRFLRHYLQELKDQFRGTTKK